MKFHFSQIFHNILTSKACIHHLNAGLTFISNLLEFHSLRIAIIILQPQRKLEQAWNKDTQTEEYATNHHFMVTMEEVNELAVIHLRHNIIHHVSHSIVDPMEDNTWHHTIGAAEHPPKEQSYNKSMYSLSNIAMD